MMKLLFATFLLSSLAFAQAEMEDFFSCKDSKGNIAKIFVDPVIFCQNNHSNQATLFLVREGRSGSNLYNGELVRWENAKGESFFYKRADGGLEISLSLPYGNATGVLTIFSGGETLGKRELNCLTKMILPDCDNG